MPYETSGKNIATISNSLVEGLKWLETRNEALVVANPVMLLTFTLKKSMFTTASSSCGSSITYKAKSALTDKASISVCTVCIINTDTSAFRAFINIWSKKRTNIHSHISTMYTTLQELAVYLLAMLSLQEERNYRVSPVFVTCYVKRDHLGFFINVEFLAWTDKPLSVEYNEWPQAELWSVLGTEFIVSISGKIIAIKINCIMKYTSEEQITPHKYIVQLTWHKCFDLHTQHVHILNKAENLYIQIDW